ncbi:hypothetical protein F441_06723 [Phytophthora nicotianae CJ01A1]|uniref:Uncharacterized protein n=3 Tax=Phytophthora nicotianae TaxID=4792 RepID=W2RCM0_PHYN3|nr:hypothetical protein PPTG_02810 [Phytophthora nicotianae INRA-310]ETK89269.1 hypothetical protein L915_06593 [Phytophthora nicotianae]ETL42723.1 hypothetical protein L916_06531 [Phytophthora nicotianae]ETN23147.1 hypothetical protein PPTG_02810 [Phytophthora nicotianae INRA-310]ETP19167.1 hypothetical protein F441_06723 [Phytophthora nicotianae CJ01A1]
MATSTAPIAIPSDIHPFASNVSPRGVDLEGRLDLSLDALIKERRKEHKLLKKEEAKKLKQKSQPVDKRKTPKQKSQQQKVPTVKNDQKAQRKALVNKNRGLPTLPPTKKSNTAQTKTKTSIAATTAKLRRQMRMETAKNRPVGAAKGTKQSNTAQQSKKKKNAPQQTRKVSSPTRVVQSKNSKKLQTSKAPMKTPVRQVTRTTNNKTKLSITITGQKNSQKKQKAATKVLLPGKLSQALAKETSATKKLVKRVKNRKATTAKTTQIVLKAPAKGKKH